MPGPLAPGQPLVASRLELCGADTALHRSHGAGPPGLRVARQAQPGRAGRGALHVRAHETQTVFHTSVFHELEDKLCTWIPDTPGSPDRLDALVWALDELFVSITTNPWERLVYLGKTVGGVA